MSTPDPRTRRRSDARLEEAVRVGHAAGVAAARAAAAADIEAERMKRTLTACCQATGYCGIGDCRTDSAWDEALSAAARIAEGKTEGCDHIWRRDTDGVDTCQRCGERE